MVSSETRRKKVVWIPFGPHDLYEVEYNELGKQYPELNLLMVCVICKAKCRNPAYFSPAYFPLVESKIFSFPILIYRKILGISTHDITTSPNIKKLYRFLKKEKPDIVISNLEYSIYTWKAAIYCRLTNTPFVLQTETKYIDAPLQKFFFKIFKLLFSRLIFSQAKYITCWTKDALNFARKNFPVKDHSRIVLFSGAVDTSLFYPEKSRVKLRKEKKELKIIMIARAAPYKRHIDLLKAASIIKENNVKFKITIVGTGETENMQKEYIKSNGLVSMIEFIPRVPYENLREEFYKHDLLVLPSYNEAIGIVVPQAMACGLPVIVSDTVGSKTYIDEGVHGLVFKSFDHEELAQKIMEFTDDKKRLAMGKAAAEHVRKNYNPKTCSEKFYKIISNSMVRK